LLLTSSGSLTSTKTWDFAVGGHVYQACSLVPIPATFEEWTKMATDNNINATNPGTLRSSILEWHVSAKGE
jgi:hypothetical protein